MNWPDMSRECESASTKQAFASKVWPNHKTHISHVYNTHMYETNVCIFIFPELKSFPFTLICPRILSNVFLRWHPAKTMKQSYNGRSHDHLSDSCVQLRTQPSWGWLLPWFWAAETWLLSSILQKIMGNHGVIGALNVPSKWNWNALKRLNTLKLCSHDMSWLPGSLVNIWLSWLCQQFHLRRVLPSHKENEDSKKSFRLHQLFALLHNANRTCMRT